MVGLVANRIKTSSLISRRHSTHDAVLAYDAAEGTWQMVELVFYDEGSSLISKRAQELSDEYDVRVWINSLFEQHGAGHVDHKALVDPDANWGWLVGQGADIIQSDESFALLEYLRSKGLHD